MEKMIILQGITVDELNKQIETIVEKKLYEVVEQVRPPKNVKYLTRVQVSESLKISLPTLNEWTKLGLVKSCKIGTRVLYKSSEICKSSAESGLKVS